MDRNKTITAIRPTFDLSIKGEKNETEAFMHSVLRPILKLQHTVICDLFRNEKHLNLDILQGKDLPLKQNYLTTFTQKNSLFKRTIIGITIGLFTNTELYFYFENSKVINKRIIDMTIVRFLSEFD